MIRFSIFGIPVLVHPFFWITLALIGGALGAKTPDAILRIFLFLLAGFISILVHELGHALTARKFGARSEIVLQAFGGYAAYSGVRLTRPQSFMVTAAGPAAQILLGLVLLILYYLSPLRQTLNENADYFLNRLIVISIYWALLNLLPVLPLDGGQMLNAILGPERVKITLWLSLAVSVSGGMAFYFLVPPNPYKIIFVVFMGMFAWQAWQALRQHP